MVITDVGGVNVISGTGGVMFSLLECMKVP